MPAAFEITDFSLSSDLIVPAIGKDLFCSRRDPIKEAQQWLASIEKLIFQDSEVLILGLGAGFHVDAFLKRFPLVKTAVLELKTELIQRSHLDVEFLNQPQDFRVLRPKQVILEFRPAWLAQESEYQEIWQKLLQKTDQAFQEAAQFQGLDYTSLVKNFQIKAIDWSFPVENQSDEVKIWRALRELVL